METKLPSFWNGVDVEVAMRYRNSRACGKYIVARNNDRLIIAFDESAEFHFDLVADLGAVDPLGGGWLVLDEPAGRLELSGSSESYGREPDREMTLRALRTVYPALHCSAID